MILPTRSAMLVSMDEAEQERWVDTMPVLARITKVADFDCGEFVRSTEWGDLWLKGEYYTLVTGSK